MDFEEKSSLEDNKKEKLKEWLKEPANLILIAILLLAFVLRLYFFNVTKDQAVWWDEAEYLLKAKNLALGTPETGFWYGRPILFSVILSGFYFFGMGETAVRIFLLIISVALILLVYLVGRELFDKEVGLIASFFFSLSYINLFYTFRIMTDIIHVFLGLLAFYFYFTKKKKLIWLVFPILVVATLIRFPAFFFFIILLIQILLTERMAALKNKNYWISAGLATFVGLPYLIWSQLKFGNPIYSITEAGAGSVSGLSFSHGISNLMQYFRTFPDYFHFVLLTLFLIGIVFFFDVLFGFDLVIKNKNELLAKKLLLIFWIIVPLFYFGFGVSHYEDRYIFMAFPPIFFVISLSIARIKKYLKKYHALIATLFLFFIVVVAGFQLLNHSNAIIKSRVQSYYQLTEAGTWIKEHSNTPDKIMAKSVPQLTYYSERETFSIPNEKETFTSDFYTIKPKYVVISILEAHPEWIYTEITKFNVTPALVYPDPEQPQLIVYQTLFE